jgi:hypothetical protein|tara:strand:- start:380 stop:880 length:501 start_codon:yes stop_codon:yes gene_type:complete
MAILTSKKPSDTYKSLLQVGTADNQELDATSRVVEDGAGNDSVLNLSTASVIVSGAFAASGASSTFGTFSSSDTSPSVAAGNLWKTDASTQTFTTLDGGTIGQIVIIISTAAVTFDYNADNFKCGSADIVTASGDVTQWVYDGTNWYLLSWMDVSADLADGSAGGF